MTRSRLLTEVYTKPVMPKEYIEYVQVRKNGEFGRFIEDLHKLSAYGADVVCFDKYEEEVKDIKELNLEDIYEIAEDDTDRYYIYYKVKHKGSHKVKHKEKHKEKHKKEEKNENEDETIEEETDEDE